MVTAVERGMDVTQRNVFWGLYAAFMLGSLLGGEAAVGGIARMGMEGLGTWPSILDWIVANH